MKKLLKKIRRRGDHRRVVNREYWNPEDAGMRLLYRGNPMWARQNCREFDLDFILIDAMMKGRGLQ